MSKKLSRRKKWGAMACLGLVAFTGCAPERFKFTARPDAAYYQGFATQIEYPDVATTQDPAVANMAQPYSFENPAELPTWELTLADAVKMALEKSEILRNTGGSVVQSPGGQQSVYNPTLTEANPAGGVEAALSAYDAQLTTQLFWQKNNRPNNTRFFIFLPSAFEQTTGNFAAELSKRTATGASFALRHNVVYDNPNSPQRLFQSDFSGWFEAEWRQPLMQGSGLQFNQIAGPGAGVGQYNGVLIARINTDIALHDFESGVIGLVNDVEGAYWELYNAYRLLDTQVANRQSVLLSWRYFKARADAGTVAQDQEAQAASAYFRTEAAVKNALAGPNGLYAAEQRLRYMLGQPTTDGRLIKPVTSPVQAEVVFDWQAAVADALTNRVEVRRQKWTIKRRELELIAARQNRRPRLDALTQYRWRGLGDHLIGSNNPDFEFESLYQNITGGQYQEWQAGLELSYPVGFRQASVAVRHAQWNLIREQALLKEQELRISHDLSTAAREVTRNHQLMLANLERARADERQLQTIQARVKVGQQDANVLFTAQQQLAASQTDFFRSIADYNLAIRNFHREKGSLLAYNQVGLSESGWPNGAFNDAQLRGQWLQPRKSPEKTTQLPPISLGGFDPGSVGAQPTMIQTETPKG